MVYIIITIFIILLDRASKILATTKLASAISIPIFDGIFHLTYAENTGMAFSLLSGNPTLLGIVSLVFIAFLSFYFYREYKKASHKDRKTKYNKLLFTSLSFIIGGAFGNLIDRFAYGYVIDMFEFKFINFAIFNVADAFVCIGAVFLILSVIFEPNTKSKEKIN